MEIPGAVGVLQKRDHLEWAEMLKLLTQILTVAEEAEAVITEAEEDPGWEQVEDLPIHHLRGLHQLRTPKELRQGTDPCQSLI
jgi:hypothetical protein